MRFKEELDSSSDLSTIDEECLPFKLSQFGLFSFRPSTKKHLFQTPYAKLPFYTKLDILINNINMACEFISKSNKDPQSKYIFAGPEYLFKAFNKIGEKRYYSEKKKECYLKALSVIAQQTDIILAPGTICWRKISKKDGKTYYRNELFLFYRNQICSYKKYYPHFLDFDYKDSQQYFKRGDNKYPVFKLNGIYIGVEICLDNAYNLLKRTVDENYNKCSVRSADQQAVNKPNVHLVVADGRRNFNMVEEEGLIVAKLERTAKYKTLIGTLFAPKYPSEKFPMLLHEAESTLIAPDLHYHKFKGLDY